MYKVRFGCKVDPFDWMTIYDNPFGNMFAQKDATSQPISQMDSKFLNYRKVLRTQKGNVD